MKRLRGSAIAVSAGILAGLGVGLALRERVARAAVHERLFDFGSQMAAYLDDGGTMETPRLFEINGQKLYFAAGSTQDSVGQVLDFYERKYGDAEGRLGKALGQKGAAPKAAVMTRPMRGQNGEHGFVVGFEWNTDAKSPEEWIARMRRATETGRLSEVGRFRYVYAYRAGQSTRFVTVWPSDTFRFDGLAAERGEDPSGLSGLDLQGIPHPAGSRRLLSASEHGQAERVLSYAVPGNVVATEAFYRETMPREGWRLDPRHERATAATSGANRSLFFARRGAECWISIGATDKGGSRVTIVAR